MTKQTVNRNEEIVKMFKRRAMVFSVVLLLAFLFAGVSSAEESPENFAVIREVSPQEAYLSLLKENETIKKENAEKENTISRNAEQNQVLMGRIKDLEGRLQFLTRGMSGAEKLLDEEKKKHAETEKSMNIKVSEALSKAEEVENRYNQEEYVIKYKEVKKKLDDARKALNDMAREKSNELVEAEKNIADLSMENEQLKIDMGKAHFNLATLFFKTGNHKKSAYEYEQTLKVMPNDPETCYNLAILYDYYLDDPEKAKGYYQKYLRLEVDPRRKKQLKERVAENKLLALMNSYGID